jgi:hypothetical protein
VSNSYAPLPSTGISKSLLPIGRMDVLSMTSAGTPGKGRAVVQSFSEDPVLGKEATAILKGRSSNQ